VGIVPTMKALNISIKSFCAGWTLI
jgi:hypothetical protein